MRTFALLLLVKIALAAPGTRTAADGEKLFLKGDYRRAAATYREALAAGLDPKDAATARWMIARSFEEAGDFEAALTAFEAARANEESLEALREIRTRIEKLEPRVLGGIQVECPATGTLLDVGEQRGLPCPTTVNKLRGEVSVVARLGRFAWPARRVKVEAGRVVVLRWPTPGQLSFPAAAQQVTVDSQDVGPGPVTVQLPPGQHVVLAAAPGKMSWQRQIQLTAGESRTIDPWQTLPSTTADYVEPASASDPWPWIVGGAGVAAVGAGAFFFVLASDSIADGDAALARYNAAATAAEGAPFKAQVEQADDDAITQQIIGGSLIAVGVGLGAMAVWWALDEEPTALHVSPSGVGWAF